MPPQGLENYNSAAEAVCYVKNQGLGFRIPYTLDGEERNYEADSLVRIRGATEFDAGGRGLTDYHINVFWSEEDGCYNADIPDLKYCSAHGSWASTPTWPTGGTA